MSSLLRLLKGFSAGQRCRLLKISPRSEPGSECCILQSQESPVPFALLDKQRLDNFHNAAGTRQSDYWLVYNPINTTFYHGDIPRHSKGVYSFWLAIQSLHLRKSPEQRLQCSLPPGEKTPLSTASNTWKVLISGSRSEALWPSDPESGILKFSWNKISPPNTCPFNCQTSDFITFSGTHSERERDRPGIC